MDSLYFYGLLALGGLCAHLYEYPPTNSTLSPIWAPTVRRNPPPLTLTLTLTLTPGICQFRSLGELWAGGGRCGRHMVRTVDGARRLGL